jgi:hypothetical protein
MLVQGGGTLGKPGSRLDVLLRGPRREATIDAAADEYRVSLQMPRWGVRLGDQPVLLSPLTEYGRVATGGTARLGDSLLSLTIGGVRTRGDWETTHLRATFGQVGMQLPASFQVRVSGMKRAGRAVDSGTVGSVQLAWSRSRTRLAEVELAHGRAGGAAMRGRVHASGSRLELNATATVADSAYPGYSRGSRNADGSVRWTMFRAVWLRAAGEDRRTTSGLLFDGGANPDTLTVYEPLREHGYQSAIATLGVGRLLQFDSRWKRRDDPLGAMRWGSERTAGMSLTVGGRSLQLTPRIEAGRSFNATMSTGVPLQRASLDARVTLGTWGALTESVGLEAGQSMYDTVQTKSWRSGTWLDARVARTHMTVGVQLGLMSLSNDWVAPVRSHRVDLTLVQGLPTGHELLARVRWDPQAVARVGTSARVELGVRMPIQLPVSRPQTSGWIRGRILGEEAGAGAPGVMVRLGDQLAMTDDRGQFQFARVADGTHVLDVDLNTVPAGTILRDSVVRTVTAVKGRRTDVQMSLVRGGGVTGHVAWFDAAPTTALDSAALSRAPTPVLRGGAPDVAVILENGVRTLSVVTDATGAFTVEGLQPGSWRVSIDANDIPATHATTGGGVVEIRPGQQSTVELRVVPRRRTIHVLEGGVATPAIAPDSMRPRVPRSTPHHAPVRVRRQPRKAPERACPSPIMRPNGPICPEPATDTLRAPPRRVFPPG